MSFEDNEFIVPDDASELYVDVQITMPTAMYEVIAFNTMWWGTTFGRRIGRALELDDELFGGPDREIVLRDTETGTERVIRPKL